MKPKAIFEHPAMTKNSRIYVAGHRGLAGSAILRLLESMGHENIITRSHTELDLLNKADTETFFETEKPEYVFLAAAKVGGILANSKFPADFIYQNMMIGFNTIHAAFKSGVKKLVNLGTSCIYPKMAKQPINEETLLTGTLEPTNDAYALAKISVIKLCTSYNIQYGTNYLSLMPTNLYGPGDNYNPESSHVLAALIHKFHEAKISKTDEVLLWGDGSPYREFLYSDDLARAAIFLMNYFNADNLRMPVGDYINIGTGKDLTISELAATVKDIVYADAPGRTCRIVWDKTKPNGTPRKLLDISRLSALGYKHEIELLEGLKKSS